MNRATASLGSKTYSNVSMWRVLSIFVCSQALFHTSYYVDDFSGSNVIF